MIDITPYYRPFKRQVFVEDRKRVFRGKGVPTRYYPLTRSDPILRAISALERNERILADYPAFGYILSPGDVLASKGLEREASANVQEWFHQLRRRKKKRRRTGTSYTLSA
jgi:hypothetical protein